MLIILKAAASPEEIAEVNDAVCQLGYTPVPVPGPTRTAICVTGNKGAVDETAFTRLKGVREVIPVTKSYKLVSREVHPHDTVIDIGGVKLGGANETVVMAGPCSVETGERTLAIAERVQAAGAKIFRAGAYKPRTSPYDFQGLGEEGLKVLARVRERTGLKIVTEAVDTESLPLVADYADIIQVGTRNMYNYSLLKRLGALGKPVLLKRGLSATVEEWLNSAEYVMIGGNARVILCERGVRTFSQHARNTLDLNVVPLIREISHLPVIVDPSHGVGRRAFVRAMARAAIACGAHGLLIEAHGDPDTAYSDGAQTVDIPTLEGIVRDARALAAMEGI